MVYNENGVYSGPSESDFGPTIINHVNNCEQNYINIVSTLLFLNYTKLWSRLILLLRGKVNLGLENGRKAKTIHFAASLSYRCQNIIGHWLSKWGIAPSHIWHAGHICAFSLTFFFNFLIRFFSLEKKKKFDKKFRPN